MRLAASAAIAAFALAALLLSRQIPSRHVKGDPGPQALPAAASVIVLAGSAAALVADTRGPRGAAEPWGSAPVAAAGVVAYLLLLPAVGYLLATALFLAATTTRLDRDRRIPLLAHLLVAAGLSVTLWLVFTRLLDVILPVGVLGL